MIFRVVKPILINTLVILFLCLTSCSSAPKKPAAIYTERNMAASQLDLANRTANQGQYTDALLILEDARRTAVSVDDPLLIIKTSITRGNIYFFLGRHDEAFKDWEAARLEGEKSGERDLAALAGIYSCRGRLMLLINSGTTTGVEEIRDQANTLVSSIKSDRQAQAAGYVVLGMAEKELGLYADAERTARRALAIHEKDLFLEEAAYDWFFIASVFSVSGRYDDALAALTKAIDYDRRAENGFGLASSWQAIGEVYSKRALPADRAQAASAFQRAADIFRAIGQEEAAAKAEARAR